MKFQHASGGKKMDKVLFRRLANDSLMSTELLECCWSCLVLGMTQSDAAREKKIKPSVVSRAIKTLLEVVPDDDGEFATNYEVLCAWWNACVLVVPGATTTGFALRADLAMFTDRKIGTMQFGRFMDKKGFKARLKQGRTYYGSRESEVPGPKLVYLLDKRIAETHWEKEALRISSGQYVRTVNGWIDRETRRLLKEDEIPEWMKPAKIVEEKDRPRFVEPRPLIELAEIVPAWMMDDVPTE